MLSKVFIKSIKDTQYTVPKIKDYVINNNYSGLVILDCYNNIHINKKYYIPQKFNSKMIYISSASFQQNNIYLAEKIRKFISFLLTSFAYEEILCIGGESYIYGLVNNIHYINHYTNSQSIYNDCEYNKKFYKSIIYNNLIDYNKLIKLEYNNITLINLSKLNKNLIKILNIMKTMYIIIISCNHNDFWNKITYLTNYKIIIRKKFICNVLGYFITVNFLKLK
jgi:hypothetical protein